MGIAAVGQHLLHLSVHAVGLSLGAMAHEHNGGLAVIVIGSGFGDSFGHGLEILIAGQQRLADGNLLEGIGILGDGLAHLLVLQAVHQMGGLHNQSLHAVVHRAVQGFLHIVNDLAVTLGHMVNDDLAGEAAAHSVLGEGLLQGALNGADGQAAAVVEAGAKAHHQQLLLADLILVAGVIESGVAGLVVLLVLFFRLGRSRLRGALGRLRLRSSGGRSGLAAGGQHQAGQHQHGQKQTEFFHVFLLTCLSVLTARCMGLP